MQVYNTLTRQKEPFTPADPARVTMYVCGPTVYSDPHIGNARPAVVFDLLYRVLQRRYPGVVYARNITDLDDKIYAAAREQGVDIEVITSRYTDVYHHDMAALGVLAPTVEPRATEHISEMIALIERLVARGHAYEAEGHVLFHVPSLDDYGSLSRRDRDDMIAGARVEVAPYKRDPFDFVLWKPSPPDLPGWSSPWGRGRPGWHTECVCMIAKHLGHGIDIHGGGSDLVFPHHENELAQARCACHEADFVRYWMHNGYVNVDQEKMSKSLGNVLLVKDLLEAAPGEAIRLALLTAHYRSPLEWTADTLYQATRRLDRLYATLLELTEACPRAAAAEPPPEFVAALEDDLNTPEALSVLSRVAREASAAGTDAERRSRTGELLAAGRLLGLLELEPQAWFDLRGGTVADLERIERLIEERARARESKDFATADRIRDRLAGEGVVLEDRPDGTRWRKQRVESSLASNG